MTGPCTHRMPTPAACVDCMNEGILSPPATLAHARRLALDAWTARTIWGRDDERTHRAVHELLGFLTGDGA